MTTEKQGMPVKQEVFLEAGVHIGTKIRTDDMKEYIFKRRDDGLYILDLRKSAERLMDSARLLARYKPEEVWVVASRVYSGNPASKFAELTGVNLNKGRFVPGTMTNMNSASFIEPKILFVCDPKGEHEALLESAKNGVPVIALCDTDNETKFIDLVIPINNKGKRSLALIFFILTREIQMAQGKIKSYDEFTHDISYFEQLFVEERKPEAPVEAEPESAEAAAQPTAPKKPGEAKAEEAKPAKAEVKAPANAEHATEAHKTETHPHEHKAEAKHEHAEHAPKIEHTPKAEATAEEKEEDAKKKKKE